MPEIEDRLVVAKSDLMESERHIRNLQCTHIDPLSWRAIQSYIHRAIDYALLVQQKGQG